MGPELPFKKPRSRAKAGPAFVFINTSNLSVELEEQDARARIRKQAARSGRRSHRQQSTKNNESDVAQRSRALVFWRRKTPPNPFVPAPVSALSYTGYELLRSQYNFDVTDLSIFAEIEYGRSAHLWLQERPDRFASLLAKRSLSFLSYLPARYGSSECLDDAIRCVAAGASQMSRSPPNLVLPRELYGKAISSLQIALNDKARCAEADVYGATRLLTLYEVR
jgi:hypothetical protein